METKKVNIGIFGCSGRMGRSLMREIFATDGCCLSGGFVQKNSRHIGRDLGDLAGIGNIGINATDDLESFVGESDIIIDFTLPAATISCAEVAARQYTPMIIGTTGISGAQHDILSKYALETPILIAPNMSIGVNLLLGMVENTAKTLDESFDIEVLEMHHNNKVDAPSGTALALGKAAADGRCVALADVSRKERDGIIGQRPKGEIGFATLRGGDVIGDHTVIFAGEGERIEISHKASNRNIFARGAVRAALWIENKNPKLYSMKDVLFGENN